MTTDLREIAKDDGPMSVRIRLTEQHWRRQVHAALGFPSMTWTPEGDTDGADGYWTTDDPQAIRAMTRVGAQVEEVT